VEAPGPLFDLGLDAALSTLGLRLNAGSEGETGTGSVSAPCRGPGDTDREGRPSTDSSRDRLLSSGGGIGLLSEDGSRERPLSRGVGISEGPGEVIGMGNSCEGFVGVAIGDVGGGEPLTPGRGPLRSVMEDICVDIDASD
jgi:hypothetical protein